MARPMMIRRSVQRHRVIVTATKWTPAKLTSVTLAAWYRLRDPNGVVAQGADAYNGTDVTAWKDRSGNGNDLPRFPKNAASDMVYTANGFGTGFDSVHTSGVYYGTGWHGPVTIPTGKLGAFAAVMQPPQSGNGSRILSIGNVSGGEAGNQDYSQPNAIVFYDPGSDGTQIGSNYGSEYDATVSPNTPLVVGTYYRDSTNNIQGVSLNGTEVGTLTRSYDNTPANLGIGTNGAYKGAYWTGDHAEYVLFVGTLSLSDRQKLEGYMAWNNGTQGSLPAGHPYKSQAP